MYSIRQVGLLKKIYTSNRLINGTSPLIPKTEKLPLRLSPKRNAKKLKNVSNRKALNISGDLPDTSPPFLLKVLLLLYIGSKDCMIPVTQKKLMMLAINRKTSYTPISAVER